MKRLCESSGLTIVQMQDINAMGSKTKRSPTVPLGPIAKLLFLVHKIKITNHNYHQYLVLHNCPLLQHFPIYRIHSN